MKQSGVHTIISTALVVGMVVVFAGYSGFAARSGVSDCINHGDVNLDGLLTAADAQLAFFITLSQYSPTYEEECAADCNGDGSVTSADAQTIFLTALGTGECEDSLEPPTPTHAPTKTPTPVPTQAPTSVPTWTPYPTYTPYPTNTPTLTPTQTPIPTYAPGDLFATDPIVGIMRFIPSGTFTQGSPNTEACREVGEAQFTHILTKNIAVMETEISRQMWALLKVAQPTLPDDPSDETASPGPNYPVQRNTWYESVLFANLLSLQNGFTRCYYTDAGYAIPVTASNYTTGPFYCDFSANGYRLPTEGEWEYFARAGATGPFSCDEPDYNSGNCLDCFPGTHLALEKYCVYCANSPDKSAPVGSKLANPWNLKDVHGNVWEWCWDWERYYPTGTVIDYVGEDSGSNRAARGGCWSLNARFCRSAHRGGSTPSFTTSYLGLRLVRTVSF